MENTTYNCRVCLQEVTPIFVIGEGLYCTYCDSPIKYSWKTMPKKTIPKKQEPQFPSLKQLSLKALQQLPEPLTKELIEESMLNDVYVSVHNDGRLYFVKYVPCLGRFYLTSDRYWKRGILLGNIGSVVWFFKRKTRSRNTKIHIFGGEECIPETELSDALAFIKDADFGCF